MLYERFPKDSLIRPGLRVGRYLWGLIGPVVDEVGETRQIGGGWVAPVRFTSGECALLRSYQGDGVVSVTTVVELRSTSHNAQVLLRDSTRLPELFDGPDPGILYLRVFDIENEGTEAEVEVKYHLRLKRIFGHLEGKDAIVRLADAEA